MLLVDEQKIHVSALICSEIVNKQLSISLSSRKSVASDKFPSHAQPTNIKLAIRHLFPLPRFINQLSNAPGFYLGKLIIQSLLRFEIKESSLK